MHDFEKTGSWMIDTRGFLMKFITDIIVLAQKDLFWVMRLCDPTQSKFSNSKPKLFPAPCQIAFWTW